MAVVLCRSDGKTFSVSPELRNAPRVEVKNEPPMLTPSHQGKKITARSDSHYACAEPVRAEVWREAYERHRVQLNSCGFHGESMLPYREVGDVELDDRKLILHGLGQLHHRVGGKATAEEGGPSSKSVNCSPVSPVPDVEGGQGGWNGRLRAKTPSQFPMELAGLSSELQSVSDRVDRVRRGQALFKIVHDTELSKREEEEKVASSEAEALKNEWRAASVTSGVSLVEETEEEVLPWQQTGHGAKEDHNGMAVESRKRDRVSECRLDGSDGGSGEDGGGKEEAVPSGSELEEGEGVRCEGLQDDQSSQQSDTVLHWYRQLCVLVWVLESMRMESPAHMPPLAQYWKINRPPANEQLGHRLLERKQAQLKQWNSITQQPKFKPIVRSMTAIAKMRAMSKASQQYIAAQQDAPPTNDHKVSGDPTSSMAPSSLSTSVPKTSKQSGSSQVLHPVTRSCRAKEDRMRRQKRLTPDQMQNLITLLEEELNYSKKQSRSQIKALLSEQARKQSAPVVMGSDGGRNGALQLPPVVLDTEKVKRKFSEAEESRKMIVHEQLAATQRDRHKALEQRFTSLRVSGNIWQDLSEMREGVEIETTAMASRKLLMNYSWYSELLSLLPPSVHCDRYCQDLLTSLHGLAHYMCSVGPRRMSRKRLIQVLGSLRPWELHSPDVAAAVQFLITRVIYIVVEDYEQWLQQHTRNYHSKHSQ